MKRKLLWIIATVLLTPILSIAQTRVVSSVSYATQEHNGTKRCATMEADSISRVLHPERGTLNQFENWLQHKMVENASTPYKAPPAVITIPVVVHVIHNGDAIGTGENITDAQVISQITVLNEDYRKMAGTPGYNTDPVGADCQINFCLAQVDPSGNPTNGIDRSNQGQTSWNSTSSIDGTLKPATIWDPTQYFNMWCVRFGGSAAGLLGYAQFPDASGLPGLGASGGAANSDGVVIVYSAFGSSFYDDGTFILNAPYDTGRSATHETGHWLGLRHTWGDGGCGVDDYCADTPTSGAANYGCPVGTNSCASSPPDMIENYLDYTDDACMNIFTNDQNTRIQTVMSVSPRRVSLASSTVCGVPVADDAGIQSIVTPNGSVCGSTSFVPEVVLRNYGSNTLTSVTISYMVDANPPTTYSWTGSLASSSTVNVILPSMTTTIGTHTFTASTTNPNGNSDGNTANDASSSTFTVASGQPVTLSLSTDCWGYETYWELLNGGTTTVINSGGNALVPPGGGQTATSADAGAYASQSTITDNWCLAAGCYDFVIYDDWGDGMAGNGVSGCTVDGSYTITDDGTGSTLASIIAVNFGTSETNNFCITSPCGGTVTLNATATNENCNGNLSGTITASASGGTTPYTYDIGGAGQSSGNFTGLGQGVYVVTVNDNAGCSATTTVTIGSPTALTETHTVTNALCNGTCDGMVNITASGGTPPYNYSGATTGMCAGSHTVTVTDGNGCTVAATFTISQPAALTETHTVTNASCNGTCDGSVNIAATGGTAPYNYSGATTGLCAGSHSVIITDGNGCTVVATFTITQPPALTETHTVINVTCNGLCDGSISVTAVGGTPPYTYSGSTTALCAGTYAIGITDANGCSTTMTATVTEPPAITVTGTVSDASCGNSDGGITISTTGGTPGYSYSWNGGTYTTQNLTSVPAGSYTLTVTDANSCTGSYSGNVSNTGAPTLSVIGTDISCSGVCDGTATVVATGGASPYQYTWTPTPTSGQGTASASGFCAGSISVSVLDNSGCIAVGSATINDPTPLSPSSAVTDEVSGNDGAINLTVTGGTGPYTFSWTGPGGFTAPTEDVTGLAGGTYVVTITDANGCTNIYTVVVNTSIGIVVNQNGLVFNLHPNPSKGVFNLSFENLITPELEITIMDVNGKLVFNNKYGQVTGKFTELIDISNNAPGTYFVRVIANGNVASHSIIMQ